MQMEVNTGFSHFDLVQLCCSHREAIWHHTHARQQFHFTFSFLSKLFPLESHIPCLFPPPLTFAMPPRHAQPLGDEQDQPAPCHMTRNPAQRKEDEAAAKRAADDNITCATKEAAGQGKKYKGFAYVCCHDF